MNRFGILFGIFVYYIFNPASGISEESRARTFYLHVSNGEIADQRTKARVVQGDRVKIFWSSKSKLDLHLHGYDLHTYVSANGPELMEFIAHLPGRFPIKVHNHGGHEESAIFYLEVYPK